MNREKKSQSKLFDQKLADNPHLVTTAASLQRLLVDAGDLRTLLQSLSKRLTAMDRDREREQTLIEISRRVLQNVQEMIDEVNRGFAEAKKDPVVELAFSADFKSLENGLDELVEAWPVATDQTLKVAIGDVQDSLDRAVSTLSKLKRIAARESAPSMIRAHMAQLRWGRALDFHKTFREAIEDEDDRNQMLRYMADHPGLIGGIVRLGEGRIYRGARPIWWQPVSLVGLFLIAVAGIPLLYLGLDLLGRRFDDWPLPTDFCQGVVAPYWLALVGSVLHLLVAFLKRDRAELSGSPLDGLQWIHIRWIQFLQGILGVGFVVFAALLVFDEGIDWKTAVLLGYSADSFVDIQLQRFEKAVTAATPTISGQLKGGGKQPAGEGK